MSQIARPQRFILQLVKNFICLDLAKVMIAVYGISRTPAGFMGHAENLQICS